MGHADTQLRGLVRLLRRVIGPPELRSSALRHLHWRGTAQRCCINTVSPHSPDPSRQPFMHGVIRLTAVIALGFLVIFSKVVSAAPADYETRTVTFKDLVATLYLPKSDHKIPAVVAFGGSDGGMNFGDANGKMIAPHGVAVLGLAYFKAPGLPATLDQIPIEYFMEAVDYLQTLPQVDGNRIGVVSGSRGSEAALLLASHDDRIKSVVVTTPSSVSWGGMATSRSAWTLHGKDVPFVRLSLPESTTQIKRFEAALEDVEAVKRATIPIETINGPILLVSAKADQTWPSYPMSVAMESYLQEHNFNHSVTHASYLTGHGFSSETAPEIRQAIVDQLVRTLSP
jgi:dienelactone hydrolase